MKAASLDCCRGCLALAVRVAVPVEVEVEVEVVLRRRRMSPPKKSGDRAMLHSVIWDRCSSSVKCVQWFGALWLSPASVIYPMGSISRSGREADMIG